MADGVKERSLQEQLDAWRKQQQGGLDAFKPTIPPESHLLDAMVYGIGAQHIWVDPAEPAPRQPMSEEARKIVRDIINGGQVAGRLHRPTPPAKTLAEYSDAELIMEMIGRGFAAMKIPDGKVLGE